MDLEITTPEKLAKPLEVDPVITGKLEIDKPISEGASAPLGLLAFS